MMKQSYCPNLSTFNKKQWQIIFRNSQNNDKQSHPLVLALSTGNNNISYPEENYSLTERNSPMITNIGPCGYQEKTYLGTSVLAS